MVKGWFRDGWRHSLARRGVKTRISRRNSMALYSGLTFNPDIDEAISDLGATDFRSARFTARNPSQVLDELDNRGVFFEVPLTEVELYSKMLKDDDPVPVPFVVYDRGEVSQYGNLGVVLAARNNGLSEVALLELFDEGEPAGVVYDDSIQNSEGVNIFGVTTEE